MRRQLALYGDLIVGRIVKWLIRLLRRADPDRTSDFCGGVARRIGPWLPAHRIGRDNLRAAFPDKDAAWIERTLRDAWDNLGRVVGEYVHMARIWDFDPAHPNNGRILTDNIPLFEALRGLWNSASRSRTCILFTTTPHAGIGDGMSTTLRYLSSVRCLVTRVGSHALIKVGKNQFAPPFAEAAIELQRLG